MRNKHYLRKVHFHFKDENGISTVHEWNYGQCQKSHVVLFIINPITGKKIINPDIKSNGNFSPDDIKNFIIDEVIHQETSLCEKYKDSMKKAKPQEDFFRQQAKLYDTTPLDLIIERMGLGFKFSIIEKLSKNVIHKNWNKNAVLYALIINDVNIANLIRAGQFMKKEKLLMSG